ncbi:MAG: hypothetical protein IPL26_06000 [Leptospiraceae bacterium]|nr:hypothetical protein [Leptospiraceae bacterium]
MKKIANVTIIISLLLSLSLSAKEVPSSGEMIVELLVRPIGFGALVVGTGIFFITLPFGILNVASTGSIESIKSSGKRLIVAPALFTFARGVGDYPGYMEEIEIVKE